MIRLKLIIGVVLALVCSGLNLACSQNPTSIRVGDASFDKKLNRLLNFNLPIISVQELAENKSDYILLDSRSKEEFEVSHIKGALWIGYKDFDPQWLNELDKDSKIITYCSVGYRSERIGLELKKMGFTSVQNLYGSIFEWVNIGMPIVDIEDKETHDIHTYNKSWSQWMLNPLYRIIY